MHDSRYTHDHASLREALQQLQRAGAAEAFPPTLGLKARARHALAQLAYKALHNQDTLHIKLHIWTLCI